MLDHLDNLLRQLFMVAIPGLTLPQVRFQPPNEDWRTYVSGINMRAINVYLVDLRENRELRSNDRLRRATNGFVEDLAAPRRVDCHYLISAWSAAPETPAVEATLKDEHVLLYQVMSALTRKEPIVPREIYAPAPLPPGFPAAVADEELPAVLLPVEGFPKYAEFWGTMGTKHPWKPAVWLVITLPIVYDAQPAGPMVTTRIAEFRHSEKPETTETWIEIGGHVFDTTLVPPAPLSGVWVRLTTLTNAPLQIAQTNGQGRFTFAGLRGGPLRLHAQAPGFAAIFRDVDIPSPTGEYDLQF